MIFRSLGPLLPLQLMLLCSMLNEAKTFTQVTFTVPAQQDAPLCTEGSFCGQGGTFPLELC